MSFIVNVEVVKKCGERKHTRPMRESRDEPAGEALSVKEMTRAEDRPLRMPAGE
ncbi:hypothetical protein OHZ10_20980 [Burkholderia arboris]|uniref:Uncharacterized protein n=1 Tax=Burkholderia arboris TaxID=488730 RepID=A0ABZ3DTI8_9BURK|nr:hypothetical protein [Burkholderia arboris]MCA8493985.1 hypothetical protein [Burkholderia arboris]